MMMSINNKNDKNTSVLPVTTYGLWKGQDIAKELPIYFSTFTAAKKNREYFYFAASVKNIFLH